MEFLSEILSHILRDDTLFQIIQSSASLHTLSTGFSRPSL